MKNFTYVCRGFLCVMLFVSFLSEGTAQQVAKTLTASNGTQIGFYEYKPAGYNPTGSYKHPIIIFLHGIGERGNGTTELPRVKTQALPKYIDRGHKMTFMWNGKMESFIVLSPQLDSKYGSWQQFYTKEMLEYAKKNLNIDTNRIILTGLSLGGGGVWNYASASLANASQFAAIAPICGTCSITTACNIANAKLPVWTEHASNDPTVSVNCTINANIAINKCSPAVKPLEFIHPDGKHVIWNRAYDTANVWHEPSIYEWFLGQNKSMPVNKMPIAKASGDVTIYSDKAAGSLNAGNSTDADGKIVKYIWRQISGKDTARFSGKNDMTTTVSGLKTVGDYKFELTVVDDRTGWTKDTITVKVSMPVAINKPPIASAGNNQKVQLPISALTLDGSASVDVDGSIFAYTWSRISGGNVVMANTNSAKATISGLVQGTYAFELKVTDNQGAIGKDTVEVTVLKAPNQLPVANAGANKTITLPINSVELNATASTDADGNIATYRWNKITGATATIANANAAITTVSALTAGTYRFELIVTDNEGAVAKDTVRVIVNEPVKAPNIAPIARASADQTIQLPISSITLDGSFSDDVDGNIATYQWTKIQGANCTIIEATGWTTQVTGLTEGTYSFELRITDNEGAIAKDTVEVTVLKAPNQLPVANAGANKTITLPINSVELNATASTDADGNIATYQWSKIQGANCTIIEATGWTTQVTGLTVGTYSFELRITDNEGAVSKDTVEVTVLRAPNQLPVANAGANKTITLPTNTVELNATASTDADGNIAAYKWNKIAGATATIVNANAAITIVSALTVGTYRFELIVSDNEGAVSKDTVEVTVLRAPNQLPVANAGANKTITLPTNTVELNATASTDADGNIAAYKWNKIAGATATIVNANAAITIVSALTVGTYRFELIVSDNEGAVAKDTVEVTVLKAPNQLPVANAGANKTITLPINSVELNATASTDADGNIATYRWNKITGATATIANANAAITTVSALTAGTYRFELIVTDNEGAVAKDTVRVIVNEPVKAPNIAPIARASADQTIQLPISSITLDGSFSDDVDGNIATYQWTKIQGANCTIIEATGWTTQVTGLTEGTYSFELRITDNEGATAKDTVEVTVLKAPNQLPVANAGANKTITLPINSVELNATASTDADGNIATYRWNKITGATATIANANAAITTVSALTAGTYRFELIVTDNEGAVAKDTVRVIVNEPVKAPNIAPIARASADQTIQLPISSITLDGSFSDDVDGNIATYQWTKIQGANCTIIEATGWTTQVTGLTEGTYSFELRITDNEGAVSKDTVEVTVLKAPNQSPVANAGANKTITLPINSVELNATASTDADGNIATYRWNKITGATATIANANAAITTVSALTAGTYRFELIVTDNEGAVAKDTVRVIVNEPVKAPNIAPIARASADQTIQLPISSITLDGSFSDDVDGNIATYQWTKIQGANCTITEPTGWTTQVTGLTEGTYSFELRITDNEGAIAKDTVEVTVLKAPNQLPVANAGADQLVTQPSIAVTLNGSSSFDTDGTIAAYEWTRISGGASTLSNPHSSKCTVTGLEAGSYLFELKITDNNGGMARDTVALTVLKLPNVAPVARAGNDQFITLPINSSTLNGSSSTDADGTIVNYSWSQISGPTTVSFSSKTSVAVKISGLVEGKYSFKLQVLDNENLGHTDTILVTVVKPANRLPVAYAGTDTVIYYPVMNTVLNATGSGDIDGTLVSYGWTQILGPSSSQIITASLATTEVQFPALGEYAYRLTVTDDRGATSSDTVYVKVVSNLRSTEVLTAYPNPTLADLHIDIASEYKGNGFVKISDNYGRTIKILHFKKDIYQHRQVIPTRDLRPGVYHLEINIQGIKRMVTRFIKQ